jgi:hypothetical protein
VFVERLRNNWPQEQTEMRSLAVIALAILTSQLAAGELPPDVQAWKKGQPAEVQHFIERKFMCRHWAGEEPYDQARATEIARAVRRLRCNQVPLEETQLRAKYRQERNVLAALDATEL